jgi:polysaccharide pyruvyl transferase WcaK-like protein
VPVVPMAYSRKFNGLFGTLGYDTIADCKADSDDVVCSKIAAGYTDRQRLKEKVQASLKQVEERLNRYEANLAQVLGAVTGK